MALKHYIIPPGPNTDRFTVKSLPSNRAIDIPHMRDESYNSFTQAQLRVLYWEVQQAEQSEDIYNWNKKYKEFAEKHPEYVL